jgi:hypothetical protein
VHTYRRLDRLTCRSPYPRLCPLFSSGKSRRRSPRIPSPVLPGYHGFRHRATNESRSAQSYLIMVYRDAVIVTHLLETMVGLAVLAEVRLGVGMTRLDGLVVLRHAYALYLGGHVRYSIPGSCRCGNIPTHPATYKYLNLPGVVRRRDWTSGRRCIILDVVWRSASASTSASRPWYPDQSSAMHRLIDQKTMRKIREPASSSPCATAYSRPGPSW